MIEIIFLSSSILTLAAGLTIVLINPWRMINRGYFIAATLSAVWLFCIFMAIHIGQQEVQDNRRPEIHFWLRMSNAAAAFLPWAYFLIKATTQEMESMQRTLRRSWPWFVFSCVLTVIVFSEFFIPSDSTSETQRHGVGYPIYLILQALALIWAIYDAFRSISKNTGVRRLETKFFLINFCLANLTVLFSLTVSRTLAVPALRYTGPFVIIVSSGLTIWALFYHRVFDARQIFTALGQRVSTLVVLTWGTVGLNSLLVPLLTETASLLVSVGLAGLLATLWDRRVRLSLGLDAASILVAPRAQIIDWARNESDTEKLKDRFEGFLREWCQTDFVAFHINKSGESPTPFLGQANLPESLPLLVQTGCITPELLERHRPDAGSQKGREWLETHQLGALIAAPRGSTAPTTLVALGRKHSLRPYTHPDIQILLELVELMDNILMHSRVAAHAARIEKMESAAMMSRGLAHDLNNLATPVSTFLLHMEGRVAAGTAEAAVLADAKHSIKVMQDYIRESLFFARRLVPEFTPVTSTEILSSVAKLTQDRALRRGVSVRIQSDAQLSFSADRVLIQRLLQNLVANGIDASRPGGTVELAAVAVDPQHLRLTVADHGTGIPAEIRDRIFEPYFTTKDTGDEVRGLGLGLAISRKIVDLHRGRIEVSTGDGQGTTIAVILPLAPVNRAMVPALHAFEEIPL